MIKPAIVVIYYKEMDSEYDRISRRHLDKYLSNYDMFGVQPEGLSWTCPGLKIIRMADHHFESRYTYNKLLLNAQFYEQFSDYSHILIYQFDSLIFSDQLQYWCEQDYDYIGAGWYRPIIEAYTKNLWPFAERGAGNGGLSLRKVDTFISHLSKKHSIFNAALKSGMNGKLGLARDLVRYRSHLDVHNYQYHDMLNEDVYFGLYANAFDSMFEVAPLEISNLFSFEYAPDFLLQATNGMLPFGCHAWYRFDDIKKFWSPHLLNED